MIDYMQIFFAFIKKPQHTFVVLGGLFGLIFVFLTPPIQVYDERAHFFQSYAVSNFDFVPSPYEYGGRIHYGAELPKSVFVAGEVFISVAGDPNKPFDRGLYNEYITQPLEPSVKDHREIGTTYSPIVYIPQAIGITIGKLFEASPLVMIWLGRLMNLVAWLVIVVFAIKIIPFGKWFMLALALNPLVVFLSASLSADVLTIALAFLFFALVAKAFTQTKKLSNKNIAVIASVLILLALTKPTNIIFAFLLLGIPVKKFKSKLRFALIVGGIIAITIGIGLLWNHTISDASEANSKLQASNRVIDSSAQLSSIIHDPLNYINNIILNYIIVPPEYFMGDFALASTVQYLGWGETALPLWSVLLYISILFVTLLYVAGRGPVLNIKQKFVVSIVFLMYIIACITAMYLYFTGLGQSIILGVQGRYFIPSLILLAGLFTARKKLFLVSESKFATIIGLLLALLLIVTTITIYIRYY